MANHIMTLSEIETSLMDSIANVPTYYIYAKQYFELLFACGCRPLEPMQIDRWIDSPSSYVTLEPAKGNNNRIIEKVTLPAYFLTSITNQTNPFPSDSYVRFRYAFSHSYIYPQAYIGNKQAALYIFRHYQFKKLRNDGFTDMQIQVIMGENTLGVAQNYIYSDVWTGA